MRRDGTGQDGVGYLVDADVPRLAGSYSPSSRGGDPGVWDLTAGPVGSTYTSSACTGGHSHNHSTDSISKMKVRR